MTLDTYDAFLEDIRAHRDNCPQCRVGNPFDKRTSCQAAQDICHRFLGTAGTQAEAQR